MNSQNWAVRERLCLTFGLIMFLGGCATIPKGQDRDPKVLQASACKPGKDLKKVTGSAWLKVRSPEASGQFPGSIEATDPDRMRMEVTNLIGATEAIVTVLGDQYKIEVPKKKKVSHGQNSWGGLPMRWATDLFLGRVPCPTPAQWDRAKITVTADGTLVADLESKEKYEFKFRTWGNELWPEKLRYESAQGAIDFSFDDPEDGTGSPKKWEAKSAKGEVKVRWRDREVSR